MDLNKGIYKRTMVSNQQNKNGESQSEKGKKFKKYFLLAECEVRTASHGPIFFSDGSFGFDILHKDI